MVSWSWPCTTCCKHFEKSTQFMANSTVQVRQTRNLLQRPNLPSVSLLSFVLVLLLAFSFSSALPLSESTSPNIRKSLGNNELIIYPAEWIKRSGGGSVNFSPGWGKRSDSFIQAYPGGFMYKRGSVNFSPGWGKRSGGSVNFSPGWGKRSGGSVNFSPGWGKRSGGTVNFSPSWGKRSGGTVNFSPSWGKRSGGSVNFSPGWGKRSGGTVNFSPSWGKRSLVNYRGLNNYFEDGIPKQQGNIFVPFWKGGYGLSRMGSSPDNHLSRLQQLSQISRLEKRNYTPVEIMNDFDSMDVNNANDDDLNEAYLDELKLGIHNWKRSVKNEVSSIPEEDK